MLAAQDLTERIIGGFYAVHRALRGGFLESVYESALELELLEAGMTVQRQAPIMVWYRGRSVGEFRADLLVERTVVVEIKAARAIEPGHEAQVLNYLRATSYEVRLLLNFGPRPTFKRLVYSNERKSHTPA